MSHIKVEFSLLQDIEQTCSIVSKHILQEKVNFQSAISKLDWEVRSRNNISSRGKILCQRIDACGTALRNYNSFINSACLKYSELDEYLKKDGSVITTKNNEYTTTVVTDKFTIKKKDTDIDYEKTEVITERDITATSTTTKNKTTTETEKSPQGVKAKSDSTIYEYNWKANNEYINEEVDVSVGTVKTKAGVKSDVVKLMTGGYKADESYDLVNAELGIEVTGGHFEILAAGDRGKLGSDVDIEVDVAKIKGDVHGNVGINEKGQLVADVGVNLMANAVEGKVSSSVTVGELKIGMAAKGYVGVGAEGGVSYDGNKLTLKLGASWGLGGGVELSLEPTGTLKEICDTFTNVKDTVKGFSEYGIGYFGHLFGVW